MDFSVAGVDWLGDEKTLRAQAEQLMRSQDGRSGSYRVADPSGAVWVTADRTAKLVDARIEQNWPNRLAADRFAGALLDAYTDAMRAALLAGESIEDRASVSPVETIPSGLSDEEWERLVRAQLGENEAELAAVRRAEPGVPPADEEVRGRNGYLTLVLRGGGPVGLVADPAVLRHAGAERLRQDVLDVFARAGLGVVQEEDEDLDGDFGFDEY